MNNRSSLLYSRIHTAMHMPEYPKFIRTERRAILIFQDEATIARFTRKEPVGYRNRACEFKSFHYIPVTVALYPWIENCYFKEENATPEMAGYPWLQKVLLIKEILGLP